MEKKSPILGAVLGFFIIGLFYSGGFKKGGLAFVGLCILSSVIAACISPSFSIIANAAGAYLGYTWINEYNASIDSEVTEVKEN